MSYLGANPNAHDNSHEDNPIQDLDGTPHAIGSASKADGGEDDQD
jgi:hypothetical protein